MEEERRQEGMGKRGEYNGGKQQRGVWERQRERSKGRGKHSVC